MADTKVTDLAAGTPEAADFLPYVDVSDTSMAASGTTKKAAAGVYALTLKVQQPGGTPGTDEWQFSHDGTDLIATNPDTAGNGYFKFTHSSAYFRFSKNDLSYFDGANTTFFVNTNGIFLGSGHQLRFNSGADAAGSGNDVGIARAAAGVLKVSDASTGGGSLEFIEVTAPAAGAADTARLYAEDNGAGKTRLVIKWSDGTTVVIATQA